MILANTEFFCYCNIRQLLTSMAHAIRYKAITAFQPLTSRFNHTITKITTIQHQYIFQLWQITDTRVNEITPLLFIVNCYYKELC